MNEKFYALPEEKRLSIINAGFEIFARNDYKKASTDDIAAKAGISKGLLFYYFHNKKTLYMFLFEYAAKVLTETVVDTHLREITDFFELFEYAAKRKYAILSVNPHITDFFLRCFFARDDAVTGDINGRMTDATNEMFSDYFANIDFTKFKDEIDPKEIYQMLYWLGDGYMHDRERAGLSFDYDDLILRFERWLRYFKAISYKEEYLA